MISFGKKYLLEDKTLVTTDKILKNLKFLLLEKSLWSWKIMINLLSRTIYFSAAKNLIKNFEIKGDLIRVKVDLENITNIFDDIIYELNYLLIDDI